MCVRRGSLAVGKFGIWVDSLGGKIFALVLRAVCGVRSILTTRGFLFRVLGYEILEIQQAQQLSL